jgi:TP901 family phage tail tape measure protein
VKAVLSGIASGIKSTFVAAKTYMTGAVNVAKDFGEQMSAVGALTSTVGTKDFEVLREKALALGRSTEFSATQAAMAMANFARTGQDTSQILQVMAPTLDFATEVECKRSKTRNGCTDNWCEQIQSECV